MARALRLARKGIGRTSPNPAVGAVIVKNGRIIAKGWHKKAGLPHAEMEAISKSKEPLLGATLYVTLEPCCHHGRTPPCTKAIIGAGITRVAAAMEDPNPLVSGRGIRQLRDAGIRVDVGVLGEQARKMNEPFLKYITTGMPFATSKIAMTLDGKIATRTGDSKWITCAESRAYSHSLRGRHDAVLVGVGTVLKDNPRLTAREKGKPERFPARIIADSRLRTPPDSQALSLPGRTIIATTKFADGKKRKELEQKGAIVLEVPDRGGRVDMKKLFRELGKLGITSVLVEGGSEINRSVLEGRLADRLLFFISPAIMGGQGSVPAFGGKGPKRISGLKNLDIVSKRKIGADLLIEARVKAE